MSDLFQESLPPQGPAARDALRCGSPLGTVRTMRLANDAWSATGSHERLIPVGAGPQTMTPHLEGALPGAYGRQGGVVAPGESHRQVPRPAQLRNETQHEEGDGSSNRGDLGVELREFEPLTP